MSRATSWFLAGLLVLSALATVWLGPGLSPDPADDVSPTAAGASRSNAGNAIESATRELESAFRQFARLDAQPNAARVPPLGDSTDAQKFVFALTIRDAGYACPDVLSALPLSRDRNSWRVSCGDLLLYWIVVDDFGRMSAEPGAYDDTRPESGTRTITIPERQSLQLR